MKSVPAVLLMREEKQPEPPSAPQQPREKKSGRNGCLVVLGIVLICSCPFLYVAAFYQALLGKEVLADVLSKLAIMLPLVGFFIELLLCLNVFKNKQGEKRLKTPPLLPERKSSNQGGGKIQQTFPTFFQLGRHLRTFNGSMELAITTLIYVLMAVTISPVAVMASSMVRGRGLGWLVVASSFALVCIASKKQRQKN